eukprot:1698253-Pleurochrysis_carterae.AAC.1
MTGASKSQRPPTSKPRQSSTYLNLWRSTPDSTRLRRRNWSMTTRLRRARSMRSTPSSRRNISPR